MPGLQEDMKVKLDQVEAAKLQGWAGTPALPPPEYSPKEVTPPPAGSVDVPLGGDQLVQAGTLPVAIGKASPTETNPTPPAPSGTWSVQVEARTATEAAGVDGAVIKVTPPVGGSTPVDVQLDYKKFQDLYGTEWASRLELKQVPECFLTTPDLPECSEAKDVPSTNDPDTGTVRATVDPATAPGQGMRTMAVGGGPTVLTATDSASGAGGTYKATSLSPSGSWTAGGSGGGFSWSYPLTVPAPPAGPAPKIGFSYSSQAVDGRTSVANGQGSWIGDGWGYEPGFIERRYRSCSEDRKAGPTGAANNDNPTDKKKGDLCWAGDSVVMSLDGSTTELVHDTATGAWIPASDDGSRVERKTGGANGDDDGEYWVVTTRDGTRYHFGRHNVGAHRYGADGTTTRAETNSVFTVPVFGNHPGEPCYQSTYGSSACMQAWRWNLDYVEDVHGNAMVVDWEKETNRYAKNGKFNKKATEAEQKAEEYVRSGYPSQIIYGLRSDNLAGPPAGRVEFHLEQRCFKEGSTTCSDTEFESKNYGDKQPWWDTPSTLNCTRAAENCYISSPSFWSRLRLNSLTTYAQRTEGSTALSKVDTWALKQSFPKQRTETHPPLWLETITRTGYGIPHGTEQQSTTLPPVSFLPNVQDMPNRVAVSATDATPGFDRLRVETIRTETGGEIYVDYSDPCPFGTSHPKPEENTSRCFPVHWSPDPDLEKPPIEWFNKYVVDRVVERDRVARQAEVVTAYEYEGDAAWAKDSDEFTKPELRTYNQWRGYASVLVKEGVAANAGKRNATEQSQTRTRYFRGMSGDAGRAKVTVKDSTGQEELGEDLPQYQSMTAEKITFTKAGGSIVSRDLTWPQSQKTATRPRDGTTPLDAFRVRTARTDAIQSLSDGSTRTVRTQNTYDTTYGLPTTVERAAFAPAGIGWSMSDQTCTTTWYVHNTDKHLIGLPQRIRTTAGTCGQAATGTLLSDTRTSYDALNAFGAAPVRGLPYQVDGNDAAGTGWVTTARTEYDALGRATKATNAVGNSTTTAFSPATGPAFTATVTNALGHTVTTKVDPGRGSALETTDTNNRKVTTAYDDLGRTTKVWTPSQKPATDKPAYTFDYQIAVHEPPVVTTSALRDNGTYEESVVIYDGLLRARQSQKEAVGGGRLITDTLYNANGTVTETKNNYYAAGEPETKIFVPETVVPNSTETAYDGLDRPVRVTTLHQGDPQHAATTRYEGEWTLTRTGISPTDIPVDGSRAVKTTTDVMGRTTTVQHYRTTDLTATRIAAPTAADANTTSYSYDIRGKLTKVTDTSGNAWTYAYDARGRKTASTDPDTGSATFGYDDLDRQLWTKDATGRAQYTTYDALGRTTELRDDAANGPLVASFTFDTLIGAKGKPVASTRYNDGKPYTTEVTGYDAEYRPTGTKTTIPDTPATKGLAGIYTYSTTYTPTGKVQSTTLPATPGGLAAEKLITRYNADGAPVTLSGLTWYTADTVLSPFGEVLRTATGPAPKRVWTTNQYDPNTGRVTKSTTDRETANPNRISEVSYGYNPVGGITSITDTQPNNRVDKQCFAYDPMGQLTEAWTGKTCAGTVKGDITAGPDGDGYWQSYTFDSIGNRTHLTDHDLTNEALNDEFTYTYGTRTTVNGTETSTQPHALAKTDATVKKPGSTVTTQSTYAYDSAGNTTRRTIGGDTQTLNWDRRNKLTTATSPGIGSVPILGLAGKCMDLQSGNTADGTPIQLYTCNATKAQQWRLTGDTLRFQEKCATNQGGMFRLAPCDGSPAQKFAYRPADKTLYHPATNQCVDVPAGNSTDGTDLNIWTCNGAPSQVWTFTNTTTYLYDASGNRLIEDNGSTRTLHLGETTVTANTVGQVLDAFRYYSTPGAPTTVRETYGNASGHKLTVQLADHHGTTTAFLDQDNNQAITRRKFDPYGNPRGNEPTNWTENRTYLGVGVADASTDLTHIGAREYDATTGRFISVDPVIDMTDPLQMNGYTYANGNPVNNSDPSGLKYFEGMYDGGFEAAPDKVVERGDHYSRTSGSRSYTHYRPETPKGNKGKGKHDKNGYDAAPTGLANGVCTWGSGAPCHNVGGAGHYVAGTHTTFSPGPLRGCEGRFSCAVVYGASGASMALVLAPIAAVVGTEAAAACLANPAGCAEVVSEVVTGGATGGSLGRIEGNAANGARLSQQLANEAGVLSGVRTVDDIIATPSVLNNATPPQVRHIFESDPNWVEETLRRGSNEGGGWVMREYRTKIVRGEEVRSETGRMIRWNPGGGHHGEGAYWRVNNGHGQGNDEGIIPSREWDGSW
ncbi:hypothetical protein EF918_18775 [Streptomyces sp. WAC06614]|nr:hypothetical protein EF918_18775 [Streptomyces sp. WAC06614]